VPTLKVYGDASGRQSGPESVVRHIFVQVTWLVFCKQLGTYGGEQFGENVSG
jgi:hypothetical protein